MEGSDEVEGADVRMGGCSTVGADVGVEYSDGGSSEDEVIVSITMDAVCDRADGNGS